MPHSPESESLTTNKETVVVNTPTANAEDYDLDNAPAVLAEDAPDAVAKHGTSVKAGWEAADAALATPKGNYPTEFKMDSKTKLIRFLDDAPFDVYYEHWLERQGKKSFISLGDDDPLTVIAGSKPRPKFSFNVLDLSEDEPTVKILQAGKLFAGMLRAANDDERRGPLTKFYWAVSRQGTGPQTTYTLERVRASELAEEWSLDAEQIDEIVPSLKQYSAADNYRATREEHLKIAREMVGE